MWMPPSLDTGGAAEATGLAVLLGAGWFSAVALGARLVTRQGKWRSKFCWEEMRCLGDFGD